MRKIIVSTYATLNGVIQDPQTGFADKINSMAKVVVSTTLSEPLEWGPATLIKHDVVEEVMKLKQQPGQDILIYGTGRLAYTLLQHGLIDEHRLWIVPILWDSGQRIFEGVDPTRLELVDTKILPSGTVILTHKLAQEE
jgi:dihydrofolate reductase